MEQHYTILIAFLIGSIVSLFGSGRRAMFFAGIIPMVIFVSAMLWTAYSATYAGGGAPMWPIAIAITAILTFFPGLLGFFMFGSLLEKWSRFR